MRSALAPRIKLNKETKNFSRCSCNLSIIETSLNKKNKTLLLSQVFLLHNNKFLILFITAGISRLSSVKILQPDQVVLSTNLFFTINVSLPLVTGELLQKTVDFSSVTYKLYNIKI